MEYENLQCVSDKGLYWVALLFGYKIIFLFSGMILAVLSRKIEVKALNESREVQATMLITSPIVMGGLIVRLLLSNYFNVVGMVYGLSSSVYGILVLGIIFLPKASVCMYNGGLPSTERAMSRAETRLFGITRLCMPWYIHITYSWTLCILHSTISMLYPPSDDSTVQRPSWRQDLRLKDVPQQ